VTTPLIDLLPVPAERDLPPGRLELRAAALVEAIEAAPRAARVRRWLTALGLLVAAFALACSVLFAASLRPHETAVAAKTVVVLAGGTGIAAFALAPRPPQLARA
jgi:ferric-dicitrate binding protein FerR (iron transport regulator)